MFSKINIFNEKQEKFKQWGITMIKAIVFNNEITIYWDRQENYQVGDRYKVTINETKIEEVKKTHYELYNLTSETDYKVKVELYSSNDKFKSLVGEEVYKTKKEKNRIDVTKPPYSVVGDGKTINTKSLQKAFDDCGENDYIYIPKGEYLTGGLRLHSDSELYVEEGATIKGSENYEDYMPKIKSRFEGIEQTCYQSLINMGELDRNGGYNCKNVVIRGGGKIVGGGQGLRLSIIEREKILLKDYMESLGEKLKECETPVTIPGRSRGRLVNMSNCQNVVLSNINFYNGPAWNIHFIYSDNIITNRCSINSKGISNGDGWNPDSSTNCTVFDCFFDTGDDCIAIKSGKNPEGNIINKPTKNIKIFDIRVAYGHSVALGSEMSGGVDGVYIWDSDIAKIVSGIRVKVTKKRGGYVKNLFVYDCTVSSILITAKYPCNDDGEGSGEIPYLENFYFENIVLLGTADNLHGLTYNCPAVQIDGIDENGHQVKNVTLKNCLFKRNLDNESAKISFEIVENLKMENCKFL